MTNSSEVPLLAQKKLTNFKYDIEIVHKLITYFSLPFYQFILQDAIDIFKSAVDDQFNLIPTKTSTYDYL